MHHTNSATYCRAFVAVLLNTYRDLALEVECSLVVQAVNCNIRNLTYSTTCNKSALRCCTVGYDCSCFVNDVCRGTRAQSSYCTTCITLYASIAIDSNCCVVYNICAVGISGVSYNTTIVVRSSRCSCTVSYRCRQVDNYSTAISPSGNRIVLARNTVVATCNTTNINCCSRSTAYCNSTGVCEVRSDVITLLRSVLTQDTTDTHTFTVSCVRGDSTCVCEILELNIYCREVTTVDTCNISILGVCLLVSNSTRVRAILERNIYIRSTQDTCYIRVTVSLAGYSLLVYLDSTAVCTIVEAYSCTATYACHSGNTAEECGVVVLLCRYISRVIYI